MFTLKRAVSAAQRAAGLRAASSGTSRIAASPSSPRKASTATTTTTSTSAPNSPTTATTTTSTPPLSPSSSSSPCTRRRLVTAAAASAASSEAAPSSPSRTMAPSTSEAEKSAPPSASASSGGYLVPPPEILDVVDAPPQPALSFSPDRTLMLELHRPPPLPPVAELARDELKLAGVRIDAAQNSRSRMSHYTALSVVGGVAEGAVVPAAEARKLGLDASAAVETPVTGLPQGSGINFVTWSRDGKRVAFTVRAVDDGVGEIAGGEKGENKKNDSSSSSSSSAPAPPRLERKPLSLWVADVSTGKARPVLDNLATVLDDYAWVSETEVVALVVPRARAPLPPRRPPVPPGPRIQDNTHGSRAQGRTFTDLLQDSHDDELFEYYCTSDVVKVDVSTGDVVFLTGNGGGEEESEASSPAPKHPSRLYSAISPSPDGRYLAVSWIERPFSRQFPAGRFPRVTQLWRLTGGDRKASSSSSIGAFAAEVARLPLADDIPIAMDSVRKGPRSLGWRPDRDATLSWIEAQDGGDPSVDADPRDVVYSWDADDAAAYHSSASSPPDADARELHAPLRIAETTLRCGGVAWGDDDLALLYESRYKDRRSVTWAFSPGDAEREARARRRAKGKQEGEASSAAAAEDNSSSSSSSNNKKKRIVFDLPDYEDAYANPGSPLLARTPRGTYVLARPDGRRALLLAGSGATPEGLRPFLDVLDLGESDSSSSTTTTMTSTRLWRSSPPSFESVGSILSDGGCNRGTVPLDGLRLLLSRESADVPPQTYIATFEGVSMSDLASRAERGDGEGNSTSGDGDGDGAAAATTTATSSSAKKPAAATLLVKPSEKQLTAFPHPHPSLTGASKQVLRYERSDGVPLTATLHTPPGYDAARDGPLPIFLWLYPREFKNKEAAGQMRRSPHEFSGVGPSSPLLFLTRGYAVLDGPTFPIVAESGGGGGGKGAGEKGKEKEEKDGGDANDDKSKSKKEKDKEPEPNDTYIEQLVASAEAAVAEVIRLGVAHPAKVAVGGHSYGAFTTANLLAHAPWLFCCGIARSGAYNRTLTPMGFQAEQRTIWEAPEVYARMSPFLAADKIKKPLLLVHGLADNNTGTFPIQSERMYQALISHGCPARLVELPFESHGYRGRESTLHVLAETDAWLSRWCREAEIDVGVEGGERKGGDAKAVKK